MGHGVLDNADAIDGLFSETASFFELTHEEKMKSSASYENYFMGFRPIGSEKSVSRGAYEQCEQYKLGYVKRPDGSSWSNIDERLEYPVFHDATRAFWRAARDLADELQRYFAVILGREPEFFDQFMESPMHNLGLNLRSPVYELTALRKAGTLP